ncbi:hypothetical protein [Nocardia sp. NPDC052112]|uniref:hypothetical protein n=1 Tax=Nocardia sp. NPDC052112 TaxID=3155646 RepID=UPI00342D2051
MAAATALTATALAAMAATSGNAAAQDPSAPDTTVRVQILPGIEYQGNAATQSAQISSPFGNVTTDAGAYRIQDAQGNLVFGSPGNKQVAVGAQTPSEAPAPQKNQTVETAAGTVAPAAAVSDDAPRDPRADVNGAIGVVATNFGLATGVGAMVGGIGGALIGCPIGAVTGGLVAVPTSLAMLSVPAAVFGCLLGAGTVGGVGAIVGGAMVGAPVGIATAVDQYNKLHALGDL